MSEFGPFCQARVIIPHAPAPGWALGQYRYDAAWRTRMHIALFSGPWIGICEPPIQPLGPIH